MKKYENLGLTCKMVGKKAKIVRNSDLFAKNMQNVEMKKLEDLFTKLYKNCGK